MAGTFLSSMHARPDQKRSRSLRVEPLEARSLLAVIDDAFEENDTLKTAAEFGRLNLPYTVESLVLADSNDWYRFTMNAKGAASHNVSLSFQHAQGNLDLELFSASGIRLRRSAGLADGERVSLSGLAAGTYHIRVLGAGGATNPQYAISIEVPRTLVDDGYEQNDTRATARSLDTPLVPREIPNLAMVDGHDWYRLTTLTPGAGTDFVAINFDHALGNLDLELYNASGQRIGLSDGVTNSEQISLSGLAAGAYTIHVLGVGGAKNPRYALRIDPPDPPPGSTTFDIDLRFSGLTASQEAIFAEAAQRWESLIVGELPNATYVAGANPPLAVDDVLIDARAVDIDGPQNILGQSAPDLVRAGSFLPIHGNMKFDTADLAALEAAGTLPAVVLHEMAHVLGFGSIWELKGLILGAGGTNPRFIGQQAVVAYNSVFGTSASGVPVENTGGAGTRDAHWRETVFGNELMTGALGAATTFPLSRVTVAAMADLGYKVDLTAADPYTRPAAGAQALAAGLLIDVIQSPMPRLALTAGKPSALLLVRSGARFVEVPISLTLSWGPASANNSARSWTGPAAEVDLLMADLPSLTDEWTGLAF